MADLKRKLDVLVIGGGNAALCAAISARRAGASVLVLEGAPKFYRGGNTRHTRNMRCAHDAATDILTGPYPEQEFFEDLLRVTGGETDEELARLMIAESKDMLNWIVEQGVRWQPSLGGTLSLGRTNSFFLGGGRAMLNALYLTAEKLGIEVAYDAEVIGMKIEHLGVVEHLHAELLGGQIQRIEHRPAAAEEERIGPPQAQRAAERGLPAHALLDDPVQDVLGFPDHEARQFLVGLSAGDALQILPEFLLRIGSGENVGRGVMGAAHVAGVAGVAAAIKFRRAFQHQHRGTGPPRADRGA